MNGSTVVYAINTAYDADNEVTSQSDPDNSYAFTFDNLGRTLTVDNSGTPKVPHVVLTEGYDSANDRTSLSATIGGTADFLNNYTFDADQRLTDETQQGQNGGNGVAPKQIEFQYNALGQFTSVARYNYVGTGPMVDIATAAYSYDGANRMTNLAYTANAGAINIDAFSFTLDNANRITARTSSVDGTVSYGYDTTNQVTGATYTGGSGEPANESYSYSKNGNRTNTGYSTGTNNQLLSDGTFNYQYDGEGNRTVRTRISSAPANDYRTTYTWDYRNRLTDVEYFNNSGVLTKHVHYVYDSFDHEIGKQVDDTGGGSYDRAEWYVLDVVAQPPSAGVPSTSLADPLLQFDQNGNLQYRYLNGPTPVGVDAVVGEEAITTQGQAGTDYWPLGDQVNTPHEVVNNASTTVDHVITNTFGVVTSESNTSIHHWAGFEGGHFDPDTVLVNDDHRWYDPLVGRWISEDPLGLLAHDTDLARYALNDVANRSDPSGLYTQQNPNNSEADPNKPPQANGKPPQLWYTIKNPPVPKYQLPPGPAPIPLAQVVIVKLQITSSEIIYTLSNGQVWHQPIPLINQPVPVVPKEPYIETEKGENPGENAVGLTFKEPLTPLPVFVKLHQTEKIGGEIGVQQYLFMAPGSTPVFMKFFFFTPANVK